MFSKVKVTGIGYRDIGHTHIENTFPRKVRSCNNLGT